MFVWSTWLQSVSNTFPNFSGKVGNYLAYRKNSSQDGMGLNCIGYIQYRRKEKRKENESRGWPHWVDGSSDGRLLSMWPRVRLSYGLANSEVWPWKLVIDGVAISCVSSRIFAYTFETCVINQRRRQKRYERGSAMLTQQVALLKEDRDKPINSKIGYPRILSPRDKRLLQGTWNSYFYKNVIFQKKKIIIMFFMCVPK